MANLRSGQYGPLVGAIDQGTGSTRFMVFASKSAELLTYHQTDSTQIYPQEGWVEQDPMAILNSVYTCIEETVKNMKTLEIDPDDIKAIGICNQRETTIIWDKVTGKPLYNAIIWLDNRTMDTADRLLDKTPGRNKDYLKGRCGLPISTYFSAVKIKWLLDNVPEVVEAIEQNRCLFGTVDSWIIWNLTGGKEGGVHVTDVTNACRTMLMDYETLEWDPFLYDFFQIPPEILPTIKSSSEIYGHVSSGFLNGVPISGCLGDQSSALVGQMCNSVGQMKNTYGTGCFLLCNTGLQPIQSNRGLLTTIAYKLGPKMPTFYALEGSVAIAGAAVKWLKDNLGLISSSEELETLAKEVDGPHGVYFVPAFSGLFAPYWQPDARGIIVGLTQYTTKAHLARATLEAICFQTKEIVDAMLGDSGIKLDKLKVDGGMCQNDLLLQLQADLLGIPVVRPSMIETTALGAAMAAGNAVGVWSLSPDDNTPITSDTFFPTVIQEDREKRYAKWKDAVKRSFHWVERNENGSAINIA